MRRLERCPNQLFIFNNTEVSLFVEAAEVNDVFKSQFDTGFCGGGVVLETHWLKTDIPQVDSIFLMSMSAIDSWRRY